MAKDPGWGRNMPALVGQWKLPVKQNVLVKAQFINFVFSTTHRGSKSPLMNMYSHIQAYN